MMQIDDPIGGAGGVGGGSLANSNIDASLFDDDDNANAGVESSDLAAELVEEENSSPLLLALDDLESRVVASLNEFKSHPGRATDPRVANVHDELASVLRPVVEVASHAGPAAARALAANYGNRAPHYLTLEGCADEIYASVNSNLCLPVLLESAQSDTSPAKRAACLAAFHALHREWQRAGSYLDGTCGSNVRSSLAGPYGPGDPQRGGHGHANPPVLSSAEYNRRQHARSQRRSELLRLWVRGAIPNLAPGTFTSASLDAAAAGRGVLSASASLKPCLRYMAERIGSADDAGALRLFLPVMRMIEGVLGRLFLERARGGGAEFDEIMSKGEREQADALRSSCIKFLEIVVLCFSNKALPGAAGKNPALLRMRKDSAHANDFSLEDLPTGHPIITREGLEEIGEYAFSTLRGLVALGGQAKIDPNLLLAAAASSTIGSGIAGGGSEFFGGGGNGSSPFTQILSIIKPAALAYLEIQSATEKENEDGEFRIDRASVELDFDLSQKSYSLSINAVQMLATKRPVFFTDSSSCLARRTTDPPGGPSGVAEGQLSRAAVTGLRTHLRSSILTLLRHFLSVTSGCWEVLAAALTTVGMKSQADRALSASRQQLNLIRGGRAARNRAAIFYEWDQSADASRSEKRQRDTDAMARFRAAKIARVGLGSGIQLPTSMADACELALLNLKHMPAKRPSASTASSAQRKRPVDLDFVIDAVNTNGASLASDEKNWYDRDGGDAWTMEEGDVGEDGMRKLSFRLNDKVLKAARELADEKKENTDSENAFVEQSKNAASQAFSRIVLSASNARSTAVADLGKQLAARLAWTLRGVKPSSELESAHRMTMDSAENVMKKNSYFKEKKSAGSLAFAKEFPLVSSCLGLELTPKVNVGGGSQSQLKDESGSSNTAEPSCSLSTRVLNEAYVCSFGKDGEPSQTENYEHCLDAFVSAVVNACEIANKKPNDNERKRIANLAASSLPHQLATAPALTRSALSLVSSMCDIEEVSRKAMTKSSKQTIADSAAAHASKVAAEKRATAALLILRDAAFQSDKEEVRQSAVDCAVAIAAGRLPGSQQVEEKALKLVMNVIFPKNPDCANKVVESATKELELSAVGNSSTDDERIALDRVRKPVVLFMALCVRRPEIIKILMDISCREGADVLSKAVKANMPKLTKAASAKHGAADIAIMVSGMASDSEATLLISFLENLAPVTEKSLPTQELIDACHEIQIKRLCDDGKKDSRFIIPVVSGIKRDELVHKLSEFVGAPDVIFKSALRRMSERLVRHSLIFRLEPDTAESTLKGMTSCEQMVYLHHLDFNAVGLPQKRYLDVIRICLEDDDFFNDRVVQAALDYMSVKFLDGEPLPLAYMRTIILTCSKHESLHSWICHALLPRLVEGNVYSDRRQWEGWMRCAKMLENTGDHGVSSIEAIQRLPEEQLRMYRAKYPRKALK